MKISINAKLCLGFGVQVLLAAALGVSLLTGISSVRRQFEFVALHDAPVIANARHLSKLVVDMETGQRGFMLAAQETFLEPYHGGIAEFDTVFAQERSLVSDNPSQVAALDQIEHLVLEWREVAAEPEIAMARQVAETRLEAERLQETLATSQDMGLIDAFMAEGIWLEREFSAQADWEGAYLVDGLQQALTATQHAERRFLFTGDTRFLDDYLFEGQTTLPDFLVALRAYVARRGREDELAGPIGRMEDLARRWVEAVTPEIAARKKMSQRPKTWKDAAALIQAGTGKALIDEIRLRFDTFIEVEETLAAQRFASATQTATRTRTTAGILLIAAIVLGTVIAGLTSRAIARPINELAMAAEAVGTGDLETRVKTTSTDEIGDLSHAFNAMVTDLEDASVHRRELQLQLLQAQKLESIGRLAAGIAHEINTPLQYVGDNTQFLEESFETLVPILQHTAEQAATDREGATPPMLTDALQAACEKADLHFLTNEVPRAIEQSLTGIDRVRKIVQSLREFSSPGAHGMTRIDLNHALESTITVATSEWKDVAEVTTDFDSTLPPVTCLAGELNQAFLCLIVNAAHAIDDATRGDTVDKGSITISTRRDREFVEIRFADTGHGIPSDIGPRIFDPFFTTKEDGRGTGHGLTITHGVVVKRHAGTIDYETEIGKGTTFIIRLPLAQAEMAA
jgi:signal transduction histidine kinase